VLARTKASHSSIYEQIFIFTQDKKGQFSIAERSERINCGYMERGSSKSECFSTGIYIKNKSLYVIGALPAGCANASYQFKYYKGKWRLIGKKSLQNHPRENWLNKVDINFLTGFSIRRIETQEGGVQIYKDKFRRKEYFLKDFAFFLAFGEI